MSVNVEISHLSMPIFVNVHVEIDKILFAVRIIII